MAYIDHHGVCQIVFRKTSHHKMGNLGIDWDQEIFYDDMDAGKNVSALQWDKTNVCTL